MIGASAKRVILALVAALMLLVGIGSAAQADGDKTGKLDGYNVRVYSNEVPGEGDVSSVIVASDVELNTGTNATTSSQYGLWHSTTGTGFVRGGYLIPCPIDGDGHWNYCKVTNYVWIRNTETVNSVTVKAVRKSNGHNVLITAIQ